MGASPQNIDFAAAIPELDGARDVAGLDHGVTIRRDSYGIAHITASTEADAWFAQGYAAAQDRSWQMECDRRRALGTWAEAAGADARFAGTRAVAADILARRLRLHEAAQADWRAMSHDTRAMFEAYAHGINAFLQGGDPLPVEFQLCGIEPAPWEPWHSLALFKVRHVLMGQWELKLAYAQLALRAGVDSIQPFEADSPPGSTVILPPGAKVSALVDQAGADIRAAAESLGFLGEVQAGSNSWAVHGSRTTTGKPIICNDSHRALDVPSVYWQVHVSCPAFDVSGATFPGVPAFPHFGYNGHVAWNITHTQADYQDLYIEHFHGNDAPRYQAPDGWHAPEYRPERINVRDGEPVDIEIWGTEHGPIVHGDPRQGYAIALRYTATDRPGRQWECLRPMLHARTVEELHETQREWVDPVNSLVSADTRGNIGFLCRGRLPVRTSRAARRMPVPGWTGEHEWGGDVPFESHPQSINPPEGFVATANQRVIDSDEPYISSFWAPPSRADRLGELLGNGDTLDPSAVAAMQGDTTSVPAKRWIAHLQRFGPYSDDAERARAMLVGWDGDLHPASAEPLLYAYFRRGVMRSVVTAALGAETWDWLSSETMPSTGRILAHWLANIVAGLQGRFIEKTPASQPWADVLPTVLTEAWQAAATKAGPDSAAWRWADHHATAARHPLSFAFPGLDGALDPPPAAVGGDSDTLQCAGTSWSGANDFAITLLSVYRQVVDFADADHPGYVIPGGVSGLPSTHHFSDQLGHWQRHERIPMHRLPADVAGDTRHTLALHPRGD